MGWTYVSGQVTVRPSGSGPHAKRFVLEEVLEHLPRVTGSEGPMEWAVVQLGGFTCSSSADEFGIRTNLRDGWWEENDEYVVVLKGALRGREFGETLREFSKWLFRLAKRLWVCGVLVEVHDCFGKRMLFDDAEALSDIYFADVRSAPEGLGRARRSSNWRYGQLPDAEYWPDRLVNLVPSGGALAWERDAQVGALIDEEYLEWDGAERRHVGANMEVRDELMARRADIDATLARMDALAAELKDGE